MDQYKLKPDGFKSIRKQMLIKSLPLILLAVSLGLGISYINPSKQENGVNALPFVIPVALGAITVGIFRAINRQKKLFKSYRLTITESAITREQLNTPTISLLYTDIHEIVKNSNGGFMIKGRTPLDVIGIPNQIDNYEHLETTLNQIRPVKSISNRTTTLNLRVPFALLTISLFAIVYLASNKIIVGTCGTVLTAIIIYSLIQIQRNKNIDFKTKRISYFVLLPLFSVIAITIFKLMAQ